MSPEELKDVRPPVDLPVEWGWLIVLLILLTLAGLIVLVLWLKKKFFKSAGPARVIRPPWDIAKSELEALERAGLIVQGKIEEYYIRLSATIRVYLERRFEVNAPEMTTEEFLQSLKNMVILDESQKALLKDFLFLSDMVKFARYSSSQSEAAQSLAAARRLIDETIPPLNEG